MKIKNYDGRSWISKYDNSGLTIHITNAEVKEVELKGSMLVIVVSILPQIENANKEKQ